MKTIGIIPARMGSSRFPGKPMYPIQGIPMIGHVWQRCKLSEELEEVYVATCDQEIYEYILSIGGKVVMTSNTHERCSSRVHEALIHIEEELGKKIEIIVMIQGDEPLVHPDMIDESLVPMKSSLDVTCVNLFGSINNQDELTSQNTIKVVLDSSSNALYMSRSVIPHNANHGFKQICIIPFRRQSLIDFEVLEPSKLEIAESIDMLRFIERGLPVRMVSTNFKSQAVDIKDDVQIIESLLQTDALFQGYTNNLKLKV